MTASSASVCVEKLTCLAHCSADGPALGEPHPWRRMGGEQLSCTRVVPDATRALSHSNDSFPDKTSPSLMSIQVLYTYTCTVMTAIHVHEQSST